MGLIDDLFSSNSYDASAAKAKDAQAKFARRGAEQAAQPIETAYMTARGDITGGYDQARGALADPLEKVGDIYEQEQLGRVAYMNALGLMGPENTEAARAMFQASPGYQYQLEQGAETGLRNRALAGSTRSGGAMTDLNAYAQNLANQDWGNWLNRLQMFNPLAANQQNAGLASTLSGIYGDEATKLGALGTWQGGLLSELEKSKFDKLGAANANYFNQLAQNRAGAAGNMWDAIKFGVGTAASLGGAAMGGGMGGFAPGTGPFANTAGQGPGMYMNPDGTWADAGY